MLFNSIEFLLFLPIVFILYWFVFRGRKWQNLLIVIASYVFYGWWNWHFLLLIVFTSFCSYLSGLLIEFYDGRRRAQKCVSALNIVLNLCVLGVFKYYNFFIESLESLLSLMGFHLDIVTISVILPVGISFYTFQALSYTIDIYKKKLTATHDIVEFFAFISFFPQLVAGPIERATNLLPQFHHNRYFDYSQAVDGCRQILWGFFKKLVVADNCALIVNKYWDNYSDYSGPSLLFLGILFTFQIYGDFSGYSDIAIGTARLFGIKLIRNFKYPYFARNISEFWRNWHISLMTWFRDYIYIPIGGSHCARWKVIRNTMIVFFISGLWHGANWTFICWGLYHACLISFMIILGVNTKTTSIVAQGKIIPSIKELAQIVTTFAFVVIGWVIFRAESLTQAYGFLTRMFSTMFDSGKSIYATDVLLYCIVMLLIEWLQRGKQYALVIDSIKTKSLRWGIYLILVLAIYAFMPDTISTFIYFQF